MTTFLECFKVILTGDREVSRKAAREVRKLLYSSRGGDGKYKDLKNVINDAPDEYVKISEEWRQENFVVAISVLYYLYDRENEPDFLFSWFFNLIQHSNGNVRHAAVRMFENEIGPLTAHIRFPDKERSGWNKFTPAQADAIIFELFMNLINLSNILWRPAYKKYKYISSLPTGPYKSVQMMLSHLENYCGEEYMVRLENVYREYTDNAAASQPQRQAEA